MNRPRPKPICTLCKTTRRHRRGLCQACYRKLREEGLPLPPRSLRRKPFARWLLRWPAEARAQLREALDHLEASNDPPSTDPKEAA